MARRQSSAPSPKSPARRPEGVPAETYIALLRKMLTVYYVEERLKIFVRAGKVSFHASTRGHEKLQIATSMLLSPGKDWFFPYYREKALMIGLGFTPRDDFLHMLSKADDPCGNGRNMSEHFSSRELRVVSPTACTGTQYLQAVGMAKGVRKEGLDEIVYVSSGEGATSEGEFFEALNYAGRDQLPVLFMIQNNGYAISVPQSVQTSCRSRITVSRGVQAYEAGVANAPRDDGTPPPRPHRSRGEAQHRPPLPARSIRARQRFVADSARFVARRLPPHGTLRRIHSTDANKPGTGLNPTPPIAA